MSSIQSNSAAVRQVVVSRRDTVLPTTSAGRPEASANEALTHAWSIGTSRTALDRVTEKVTARRAEECPPEVYIG